MDRMAILFSVLLIFLFAGNMVSAQTLTDLEKLGGLIYRDTALSLNGNQSCMTCHHPMAGFADPVNRQDPVDFPVSEGSVAGLFGGRNAPVSAYAGFSPVFYWDPALGSYVGGMFWDGRATGERLGDPLAEQAQGPFLNPVEMAMGSAENVVNAVSQAAYANLFLKVFPGTDFSDVSGTYDNIGRAISAFEKSSAVTKFRSKFDLFWDACRLMGIDVSGIDMATDPSSLPQGILTTGQLRGLALFNDPGKGNCAACHVTADFSDAEGNVYPPLFTNYSYDNLGIPTNPRVYELAGGAPPDLGLGGRLLEESQFGKFKVPTLRNVNKSAPYGHNGYFASLYEVVNFINTRDVGNWEPPEVQENVTTEIGNLGLTREEERAIVSFLNSLTDD